ncbi:nucleoside 2-deoxyribosyltransferase [Lichenicoccus roseus]|uniref:Nucleoside 2-deoxyribosyltransferase n=1 Tax=Lichenicoccus roseus TaxID=2683649 RepID=A0A5R9J419_9PROT|nr:nucleoside 2-deoxyribosyltransferase [Lichenicoccus roseus]TLU72375.1 nucleoside 2-deoxyribosyltransferase [Lichenicoccus roseus]
MLRVYLAGPDVFVARPERRGEVLKAICAGAGLEGVFPLDPAPAAGEGSLAERIARGNEAHIRSCGAVIANLTPFRGPGSDAGTVYEIGFARALGLTVFGWSESTVSYADRCRIADPAAARDEDGRLRDRDGLEIEEFGLADNLMITCGIAFSGGRIFTGPGLDGFRECVGSLSR